MPKTIQKAVRDRIRISKKAGTDITEEEKDPESMSFEELQRHIAKMMKQMNQMGKGKRKNARFNKNLFGKLPGGLPNDFPGFK